eukprot:GABV01001459.1.p1 GENE.GABV01001459.1~~GABV01001459.1.p1  ORF type:complete len:180 (+),score=46.43 GABV01001459.1:142-681(+)
MRLTKELLDQSPVYLNALRERELGLRGYKVAVIENLGVLQDQFDSIDFSDNAITSVGGFPLMKRIVSLLFNNNQIHRIEPGLGSALPSIESLMLINNRLEHVEDLNPLAEFGNSLLRLSCLGNPVVQNKNYRLYVIHLLPKLKHLDFEKVRPRERQQALQLYGPSPLQAAADKKDSCGQ